MKLFSYVIALYCVLIGIIGCIVEIRVAPQGLIFSWMILGLTALILFFITILIIEAVIKGQLKLKVEFLNLIKEFAPQISMIMLGGGMGGIAEGFMITYPHSPIRFLTLAFLILPAIYLITKYEALE